MKAKLEQTTIKLLQPADEPYEVYDTELTGFMLRIQKTGVMTYYFTYRNSEKKMRRVRIGRHGQLTPVAAREVAKKLAARVALGEDVQASKVAAAKKAKKDELLTFGRFLDKEYSLWRTVEKKQGKEDIKRIRNNFSQWYDKQLPDINAWLVTKWRKERLEAGIHPKTVNRDITCLKSAFSYAVDMGLIDANPLDKVKKIKVDNKEKVRFLSAPEETVLRAALDAREQEARDKRESANRWRRARNSAPFKKFSPNEFTDHVKPLVLLLMNTGCRPAEILELTWDCVLFKQKLLTVKGDSSKSGQTRHIPLSKEAFGILLQWRNQTDSKTLVFPSPESGKVMHGLPRAITRLIRTAGLEEFRPYDLRHSFASRLAMAGIDLNTIRELLGHADISTTLIYAHLSEDHRRQAIASVFDGEQVK